METSLEQLAQQAQAGNRQALERLVAQVQEKIYNMRSHSKSPQRNISANFGASSNTLISHTSTSPF